MLDAQFDKGVEALQRVLDNAALRGDDLGSAASRVGDLLGSHRADSALLPLLMFSLPEHEEHAVVLLQKMKSRIEQNMNPGVEFTRKELPPSVPLTP